MNFAIYDWLQQTATLIQSCLFGNLSYVEGKYFSNTVTFQPDINNESVTVGYFIQMSMFPLHLYHGSLDFRYRTILERFDSYRSLFVK